MKNETVTCDVCGEPVSEDNHAAVYVDFQGKRSAFDVHKDSCAPDFFSTKGLEKALPAPLVTPVEEAPKPQPVAEEVAAREP